MKNTILYDFNNLAVRMFTVKEVEALFGTPNIQLWRYFIFSDIYNFFKETEASEVVLAVDSSKSWRKFYWNRYKESRKPKRDSSGIDWDLLHHSLDDYIYEIADYLPFKVLRVHTAEADDIIATLCKELEGRFIIHSTDEDYLQLCSDYVKIYNPKKKEYVYADDIKKFLLEKILTGQKKDDIFNILTPLDWPKDKRKPGFGPVAAKKVMETGYEGWLKEKGLEERFKVNRILIDFNKIPGVVKKAILKSYKEYSLPEPDKIYTFLKKNNFRGYLEEFNRVEARMLELYGGE